MVNGIHNAEFIHTVMNVNVCDTTSFKIITSYGDRILQPGGK